MYSVIRNVSLGVIVGLGLVACSDDDKAGAGAPAKSAPAASATAPAASGGDDIFSSLNIEKAEGVIYQDEIYANWPYN
jgi:hypothetical protein